jgi:murein DD-endopeptidase MepM/ murein hydrolase activator NlpD
MRRQGWTAIWRRKQYVIAGAFVVIAVIATTMIYSSKQEQARRQLESQLAEEISLEEQSEVADAGEEENAATASSVISPKQQEKVSSIVEEKAAPEETTEEDATVESKETPAAVSVNQNTLNFSPEDGMIWPMEGNVILNYSMDSTVYFATLDQYKYNPAVIIAGEVNNKVYSVAKGKVESIVNSEETGCTVTVDLGNGYQAVYGQLKELNFAVGDYVEAGHVLGYISEPTKYYSVEGSNLYFQLLKDGSPVNPVGYFE